MNREKIRQKYGGKCAYSGTELKPDWQIDHIRPLIRGIDGKPHPGIGGSNEFENLVPCQKIVNHYKGSLDLETFRNWYLGELHERLKRLPKNPKTEKSHKKKNYLLEIASLFEITPNKPFNGKFYFEYENNLHRSGGKR